jgi:hypothetical protein
MIGIRGARALETLALVEAGDTTTTPTNATRRRDAQPASPSPQLRPPTRQSPADHLVVTDAILRTAKSSAQGRFTRWINPWFEACHRGSVSKFRQKATAARSSLTFRHRGLGAKSWLPPPATRRRASGQGGRCLRGRRDSEVIRGRRAAARPARCRPSSATLAWGGRPRACWGRSSSSPYSRCRWTRRLARWTFAAAGFGAVEPGSAAI